MQTTKQTVVTLEPGESIIVRTIDGSHTIAVEIQSRQGEVSPGLDVITDNVTWAQVADGEDVLLAEDKTVRIAVV